MLHGKRALENAPCSAARGVGHEHQAWMHVAAVEFHPLPQFVSFLQGRLQDDWAIAAGCG